MITQEDWMNLRALKPLKDAGYRYAAIAAEAGCDWRTAKKYLEGEAAFRYGPRPPRGKLIDPFTAVIDEWLRAEIKIRPRRSTNASWPTLTTSRAAISGSRNTCE